MATVALRNDNWLGQTQTPSTYRQETEEGTPSYVLNRPWDAAKYALASLAEPFLFLFALATVAITWSRLWRQHVLLLAVAVAVIAPYMALHFEARYVLPASFVYMILLGLGLDLAIVRRARQRATAPS
jgi:hypothetical protein